MNASQKEVELKLELPPASLPSIKQVPLFAGSGSPIRPYRCRRSSVLPTPWRKLRKKRKTLAQLNARGRHKLRIETKKLRYAAEFFATLFANKRAAKRLKRLLPVLERLQDGLGELNDIAVDKERLAAIGVRHGSKPNRACAAGLLSEREDVRVEAAMAVATETHARIAQSNRSGDDAAADCSGRDY